MHVVWDVDIFWFGNLNRRVRLGYRRVTLKRDLTDIDYEVMNLD